MLGHFHEKTGAWPLVNLLKVHPSEGYQKHTEHTANGTLPTFARADAGGQFLMDELATQSPAKEIGKHIGRPHHTKYGE